MSNVIGALNVGPEIPGPDGAEQGPGGVQDDHLALDERGRVQRGPGRDRGAADSFVSIASDHGASIEDIADAAGHVNPNVTRAVYRHQISDTVTRAPAALDQALAAGGKA